MRHAREQPGRHRPQPAGRHRPPPPGRRRLEPERGRRRAVDPGPQHRGPVRPRYGRIAVLGTSLAVIAVAVLGNLGVLSKGDPQLAAADAGVGGVAATADPTRPAGRDRSRDAVDRDERRPTGTASPAGPSSPDAAQPPATDGTDGAEGAGDRADRGDTGRRDTGTVPLPAGSGEGVRAVFSESQQRVWLVGKDETVLRTYLASGSVYDNLDPGTYEVFSRSRHAVGIDDSGTMEYFVRFTHGDAGAAIGFHSIPVDDGVPVQTREQLGTPLSHGCIRQALPDAIAMWEFADIGTTVVVTP